MTEDHEQQKLPPPPREPKHPPLKPAPLSRSQIQHLHLAGTVSIPPHFPDLGRIWLLLDGVVGKEGDYKPPVIRVIEHIPRHPSANVVRSCLLNEVAAIFIPHNPKDVQLSDGDFHLSKDEIVDALKKLEAESKELDKAVLGIVYVREAARVHTEVSMGMVAVQSAEFEAPLGKVWCE